ncbi:MAG: monovalent cation/H(+) antiporter subunit G [bacterium]
MNILGNLLIIIGICFILIGAVCVLLLPDLYARLLACAQIDTIGLIFVIIGLVLISDNQIFNLKVGLILVVVLFINPISSYAIGRSAYLRGERPEKEKEIDNG